MTWAELTATADDIRSANDDILPSEEYDDDTVIALFQTEAKTDMLIDLEESLGLDYDDETDAATLDEIVDNQQRKLRRALAYKQLAYIYQRHDQGEGTINRSRLTYYRGLYDKQKQAFAALALSKPSSSVVQSLPFTR